MSKLLSANKLVPKVHRFVLNWPVPTGQRLAAEEDEIEDYASALISDVKSALGLPDKAADKAILERLKRLRASSCFSLGMALEDWREPQVTILKRWLQWWQSLDFQGLDYPILTAISVTYTDQHKSRSLSRVRRSIEDLEKDPSLRGNFHVLPELDDVGLNDLDQWINDYAQDRDRETLRNFLRRRFERRRLPMMETAAVLKVALASTDTVA